MSIEPLVSEELMMDKMEILTEMVKGREHFNDWREKKFGPYFFSMKSI